MSVVAADARISLNGRGWGVFATWDIAESTVGVGMMPVRAVSLDAPGSPLVLVAAPVAVVDVVSVAAVDALVAVLDGVPVTVVVDVLVVAVVFLSELHPIKMNDSTIIGARSVGMSTTEMARSGLSWITLLSSKPLQCCACRSCTAIKS